MSTPQSHTAFMRALRTEIEDARIEAAKMHAELYEDTRADGYLGGLMWVWEYFTGEPPKETPDAT